MIPLPEFFPDTADFATALGDPRIFFAVGIAILAGVVRGFSGFGSALIFVPPMMAVYGPGVATVTYVIIDLVCVIPFAVRAIPQASWREILPAFIAAAIAIPFGTMTQMVVDPAILRWAMCAFVLAFVVILIAGWRYRGKPNAPAAFGVGLLSGFAGGATQMSGPPVILYWLGSPANALRVRANLMVYLTMVGLALFVNYAWHGLMSTNVIAHAILLWPVYILSLTFGARWFRGTSDQLYRRIAYGIVAAVAIVSLPLFDALFR